MAKHSRIHTKVPTGTGAILLYCDQSTGCTCTCARMHACSAFGRKSTATGNEWRTCATLTTKWPSWVICGAIVTMVTVAIVTSPSRRSCRGKVWGVEQIKHMALVAISFFLVPRCRGGKIKLRSIGKVIKVDPKLHN